MPPSPPYIFRFPGGYLILCITDDKTIETKVVNLELIQSPIRIVEANAC